MVLLERPERERGFNKGRIIRVLLIDLLLRMNAEESRQGISGRV